MDDAASGPKQETLFSNDFELGWLPNETVFSYASRFHRLSGNPSPSLTAHMLFGHAKRGYQHDLAAGLGELTKALPHLGAPEDIATTRTLLSYYLPFQNKKNTELAIDALCGEKVGGLKYQLGILTSRIGSNHPLKACSRCISEDIEEFGVGYWHLDHQYPTALICLKHDSILRSEYSKSSGSGRFRWMLPDETNFADSSESLASTPEHRKLTQLSLRLAALTPSFVFDPEVLTRAIRGRMEQFGLSRGAHQINQNRTAEGYLYALQNLQDHWSLRRLPRTSTAVKKQIVPILRNAATTKSPVKQLTVLLWLFESWEDFWESYTEHRLDPPPDELQYSLPEQTQRFDAQFVELVQQGMSITAAAKRMGISVSTAQRNAAARELQVHRRPKRIRGSLEVDLIQKLELGTGKKDCADDLGISVTSINRYLALHPSLKEKWSVIRFEAARSDQRRHWRFSIQQHGLVKDARAHAKSTYAWLYRHDREWLTNFNEGNKKPPKGNNSRIDWQSRDQELHSQLLETYRRLVVAGKSPTQNSIKQICESVPSLGPYVSKLDRLPKTNKVVQLHITPKRSPRK